jgi:hypothetical protein
MERSLRVYKKDLTLEITIKKNLTSLRVYKKDLTLEIDILIAHERMIIP